MAELKTYTGLLSLHSWGEADDILFLSSVSEPFAEELQWIVGKQATVRYWITDKPATRDEAHEDFVRHVLGAVEGEFGSRYSEHTGYLWTDEKLTVGGHDLIGELKAAVGKWLILEVET
jgi:hypothetical protein